MTEDWDFYALTVDDQPASIFVDLGIASAAPVMSLPNMAYIRLRMNKPRPDGLSSQEEFDALIEIEKHIEATLCGEGVGYVGRNTSGGCRDFYFYTSDAQDWQSMVGRALADFPDYRYDTGTCEDAAWSTYFGFLLPGKIGLQRIKNRRVCEALAQHGDALTAPREIDHWSFFPSRAALDAYVAEVTAEGFQVRNLPVSTERGLNHGAQIWRLDVPSYTNIHAITIPLLEATERHGGKYDGWESPVEA